MTKPEDRAAYDLALAAFQMRIESQCGHMTTDEGEAFEDGWDACMSMIVVPMIKNLSQQFTDTFTPPRAGHVKRK